MYLLAHNQIYVDMDMQRGNAAYWKEYGFTRQVRVVTLCVQLSAYFACVYCCASCYVFHVYTVYKYNYLHTSLQHVFQVSATITIFV